MIASLFDGKNKMRITQLSQPVLGPYDAMILVRETGICGSDLIFYSDQTKPEIYPGGHEVAGEIVDVGNNCEKKLIGQRVAIDTVGQGLACGKCRYCEYHQYQHCEHPDQDEGGGFAQYMKRRASGCYVVPDHVSWEEAALVEPFAVSIHAIRLGKMVGGDTVAILGAGNIGLTTIAAARAMGAGKILVTARHEHQKILAKQLGADVTLNPSNPELLNEVLEVTDGAGVDIAIETVGGRSNSTINEAIKMTRKQGRVVTLGCFQVPVAPDWLHLLVTEKTIVFSHCYSTIDGIHDYEIAIDLMSSGKVNLKQMVTHKYPLDQIQTAFKTAYNKKSGSIKVHISQ
jgi:L-iditol 2-dehydrogenase